MGKRIVVREGWRCGVKDMFWRVGMDVVGIGVVERDVVGRDDVM